MRGLFAAFVAALCWVPTHAVAVAPTANLHELEWLVHVDMIDAGAGRDLAFYEAIIDQATADAAILVEGDQGPADSPCCDIITVLSVGTFGTPGDGLDAPDSAADQTALNVIVGASGSTAFLVDSIGYCGAPTSTAIGCAARPACSGNPNDDPGLKLIVSMEAHEVYNVIGETLAHERGHNACLAHVTPGEQCLLMSSSAGGGCLTASNCTDYDNGRNNTGGTCACHDGVGGTEDDGNACTEGAVTGLCSGGLCGAVGSDASVQLVAAGGPEAAEFAVTDDALITSGLSGGWVNLGAIGANTAPTGLAYAPLRGTLYAVNPIAGDDELITLDPATGARTGTIGTLSGKEEVPALAFDPGPTDAEGDDRLLALVKVGGFEDLFSIDPDDASVIYLGQLSRGTSTGFQGLAYDSINDKLYTSGWANSGIYEIDYACPSFWCVTDFVPGISVARVYSSLAFSEETGRLYLSGSQSGPRTLFDSIDATTFEVFPTIGTDDFTPGGLAAIPLPEPHWLIQQAVGILALAGFARRRRLNRTRA
jgi:DNA-binding beta-propeller fold protein YncE